MFFIADENIEKEIVSALINDGHEVSYSAQRGFGVVDEKVLQFANSSNALLLTADKDFGELIFRLGRAHAGVVLLRFNNNIDKYQKARMVSVALKIHGAKMPKAFSVITKNTIRIRKVINS